MLTDRYVCSLCGFEFDATLTSCHSSCPLSTGCHLICCPNCGYQAPDESQTLIAGTLKRLWISRKNTSSSEKGTTL